MPHFQTTLTLPAKARGVHLITQDISDAVNQLLTDASYEKCRWFGAFISTTHTSAGLAINENADPDVRLDLNDWLDKIAPKTNLSTVTRSKGRTTCLLILSRSCWV